MKTKRTAETHYTAALNLITEPRIAAWVRMNKKALLPCAKAAISKGMSELSLSTFFVCTFYG